MYYISKYSKLVYLTLFVYTLLLFSLLYIYLTLFNFHSVCRIGYWGFSFFLLQGEPGFQSWFSPSDMKKIRHSHSQVQSNPKFLEKWYSLVLLSVLNSSERLRTISISFSKMVSQILCAELPTQFHQISYKKGLIHEKSFFVDDYRTTNVNTLTTFRVSDLFGFTQYLSLEGLSNILLDCLLPSVLSQAFECSFATHWETQLRVKL